jgi:SAM-dependent methyltransferase
MNFNEIADNLTQIDGIWVSSNKEQVSYPEDGNDNCMAVEDTSFWFQHRNSCILEVVKQTPPSGPIFDIGGGNGFVANGLSRAGFSTFLVEPGQTGILNAKNRGVPHLIQSTLKDAGFHPSSLSNVGLFDVIEHIQCDTDFLNKVHHYLSPGGLIYITVPAYNFLWSHEDTNAGHHRRYTLGSLAKKLERAGFSTEFGSYFFSILPLFIFPMRTLPHLFRFHNKAKRESKSQNEHSNKKGPLGIILNAIWKWEISKMSRKSSILFGGSCVIVARKC